MFVALPRPTYMPPTKFVFVAVFVVSALFLWGGSPRDRISSVQDFAFTTAASRLSDTKNETLGFSKIFVLSLSDRTDKQDGIVMGASLSGFKFDWINGVKGSEVSQKALPKGWVKEYGDGALGCWRGHLDIAQKMIKENIQTALILEDDADWDVMIKEQFYEFAKGTQALQNVGASSHSIPYSPYGDDWDLLWTGHCAASNSWSEDGQYYVIPNDPTVPPLDRVGGARPNRSPAVLSGNRTRLIFQSNGGRCTASYGLSLRGAHTLVYIQALTVAHTIDRGLSRMCNSKDLPFKCLQSYPTLIGAFKDAGDTSKDSDRSNSGGKIRKTPETRDIAYPVRLNIGRLLSGEQKIKPQWPEGGEWPEISKNELIIPGGHLEFVTKDQFVDPAPPISTPVSATASTSSSTSSSTSISTSASTSASNSASTSASTPASATV